MPRCVYSAKLTVSHLIELVKVEFSSQEVPKNAYYQHHASLGDLEGSAIGGCDLCKLIFECFRGTPQRNGYGWPAKWVGRTLPLKESMLETTKDLLATDVKIFIDSEQLITSRKLDEIEVFDSLRIHIGPVKRTWVSSFEGFWDSAPLALIISKPPSESSRDLRGQKDNLHS